jgi:DNA-binding Xre family transcriptional regulator
MIKSKLHDLLWQMRITQKELAKGTGLAESTVSKLVHGDEDCRLSTIDKVCNYLQCKLTDVIEFKKD